MKEKSIRLISKFLTICMVTMSAPVYAENADDIVYAKQNQVFVWDCEGNAPSVGKIESAYKKVTIDEEHGTSIAIDSTGGALVSNVFTGNAVEESEADIISFDFYADKLAKGYTGLRVSDEIDKRMFYIRQDKTLTVQEQMEGNRLAVISSTTQYKEKQWYHLEAFIDNKERVVTYYIDGARVATTPLPQTYKMFNGLIYYLEAGGIHVIDNILITQVLERGVKVDVPEKIVLTDDFAFKSKIESDNLGFIYFSKNVEFKIPVKNHGIRERVYEVDYTITSKEGVREYIGKRTETLQGLESKEIVIEATVDTFGYHTIRVDITEVGTENVIHDEVEFTVVNAPDEGTRNEYIGSCVHFNSRTNLDNMEEEFELFSKAGFGGFRESILWAQVEPTPGAVNLTDVYLRELNAFEKYDMERFTLLALGNAAVTPECPPRSPEAIAAFANYAEQVAKQTKGKAVKFELWNEYGSVGGNFNPDSATVEDYVNLLKEVYPAVKRGNPDAIVYGLGGITGLLEPPEHPHYGLGWIDKFFALGGGEYCDAISIHPYGNLNGPEGSLWSIEQVKAIAEEYGYEHLKIAATEVGWSTYQVTEDRAANWIIQLAANSMEHMQTFYWYVDLEKDVASLGEKHFGMLRAYKESVAAPYEPFAAKPAFIALTNFNALMTDATPLGKYELDGITCYRFKDNKGQDVAIVWNDSEDGVCEGFKIDTDKVKVYDLYGNATELKSSNGNFVVNISEAPTYIVGSFENVERGENYGAVSTDELDLVIGDSVRFNVTKNINENVAIELDLPENIKVKNISEFNEFGVSCIELDVGMNKSSDIEKIGVRLIDPITKEVYYTGNITVNYKDSVNCRIYAEHIRSRRWAYKIELKNASNTRPVSGVVKVTEPEYIANTMPEVVFENIGPLSKTILEYPIPEGLADVKSHVEATIILDNGDYYYISDDLYFASFVEAKTPPVIDGKLDIGEWDYNVQFQFKYENQVQRIPNWTKENLSANLYTQWDDDYFYLAGNVTDDALGDGKADIWANDSIQFAFADKRDISGKQTEYGLGFVSGEPRVARYSFMATDTGIIGATDMFDESKIDVAIVRDEENKKTYYEARFPWEEIFGEKINPKDLDEFIFSMMLNENDGEERLGWIEFCPGIGSVKDVRLFEEIPVFKNLGL